MPRSWPVWRLGAAVSLQQTGARWWFDEGVAHAVALQVLLDMGVIGLQEVAGEVSSWLAEEALSDLAGAPLEQLATTVSDVQLGDITVR